MHIPQTMSVHNFNKSLTGIGAKRPMNRIGSQGGTATDLTTVGGRMIHRRLELQLTQAQVAAGVRLQAKSGKMLSRNTYCMYETGKYEPRLKLIEQIAAALKVSPGWLAFGNAAPATKAAATVAPLSISFRWSNFELLPVHAGVNEGYPAAGPD